MNYINLCDFQVFLGFACILLLLEFVHVLMKFAQMTNIFVCNLVIVIKVCQSDIYKMYFDQTSKFPTSNFWAFKSLLEFKHENIQMQWVLDLNSRIWHLTLETNGQHIWAVHWNLETNFLSHVTKDVFVVVKSLVKNQCKGNKTFPFCSIFFL